MSASFAERFARPRSFDDQPVMLWAAVLLEIEHILPEIVGQAEIAINAYNLVRLGDCLGGDFAGGRDDAGPADHVKPILDTAFGGRSDPSGVLVGVRLQRQQVMEHAQVRWLVPVDVPGWRVIAQR